MSKTPHPMRPRGIVGSLLGLSMDIANRAAMSDALKLLELTAADRFVEIGFGTGALLSRAAAIVGENNVAGVDPSEQMVKTAKKRVSGDLRLGEASSLPWPDQAFTAAAAVHCFQFFADPAADLRKIHHVLAPGGRFALVLRQRSRDRAAQLPNPLSRSADEVGLTMQALEDAGFIVARGPEADQPSPAILALALD